MSWFAPALSRTNSTQTHAHILETKMTNMASKLVISASFPLQINIAELLCARRPFRTHRRTPKQMPTHAQKINAQIPKRVKRWYMSERSTSVSTSISKQKHVLSSQNLSTSYVQTLEGSGSTSLCCTKGKTLFYAPTILEVLLFVFPVHFLVHKPRVPGEALTAGV